MKNKDIPHPWVLQFFLSRINFMTIAINSVETYLPLIILQQADDDSIHPKVGFFVTKRNSAHVSGLNTYSMFNCRGQ